MATVERLGTVVRFGDYNCGHMTTTATDRFLAPGEAAQRLRCSIVTVYRAINRGELKARRLGAHGSLRISEDAVERFMRPVRTPDETSTA